MSRPWMPWYVADFVADTQHLDAAQSGAYMMLIGHYWVHGCLPDNDAALARIARMTPGEWRKARAVIQGFFHDGWLHKRIDEELAHAADVSNKRKAAAEQKHHKQDANAGANAEQLHTQSPSPSHLESKLLSNFGKPGEKKTNGWSPPKHGAQSTKHKTVYILKTSAEWPAYVEAMGYEPVADAYGGFWFPLCGATTIPPPKRFSA
jgi:uncharacterized protein YdaU (DUF1376 family)